MRALGVCLALTTAFAASLAASCSRGEQTDDEAYHRDIDRLCNAQEKSGAEEVEPGHRPVLIAQWLAENLETDKVRDVLVEFQSGSPAEKRAILEREAAAVGLSGCPLADTWADETAETESAGDAGRAGEANQPVSDDAG